MKRSQEARRFSVMSVVVSASMFAMVCFTPVLTTQAQASQPISTSNADKVARIAVLQGHTSAVFGLVFSPDSTLLASAGVDKTVRLWDVKTAKQTAQLDGHTQPAILVGFSADGMTVFSMGYEPALRLWDVKSGKQSTLQQLDPNATDITAVEPRLDGVYGAFNPNATLLAHADGDGVIVWSIKDKQAYKVSSNDTAAYGPLAFSRDGKFVAAASAKSLDNKDGNFVHIWNVDDVLKQTPRTDAGGLAQDGILPTRIATGAPESFYGNALALSPDGTQIAVEDIHNTSIRILDVKTGKEIEVLAPQFPKDESGLMDNYIHGLTYSPDGSLLAVASYDKTVRLWDVKAGKELKVLTASGQAVTVTFSADGLLLASSTTEGPIDVWGVK